MAAKVLTVGTMSWTLSTRALSGGTVSPALDNTDVGKAVTFLIGSTPYAGRIASVVNANTMTLYQASGLPANGTVTQMLIPALSMAHSFSDYISEIESLIKQDVEKITLDDRKRCLRQAVTKYGEDEPYLVAVKGTGDGTKYYNLATLLGGFWKPGHTQIHSLEYPSGIEPLRMLEPRSEFTIYDDGTAQDGSNLTLRFILETPASSEGFIVRIAPQMVIDETTGPNFADPERVFKNITLLAGSLACERLSAAYAQSSDATITADTVNYHDKSQKYMSLAKQYRTEYNLSVFGQANPPSDVKAAFVEQAVNTQTELGMSYLFHTRVRHPVIR